MQGIAKLPCVLTGLGLLSMPYALAMGGWAGLMVQAGVTLLFATCGVLLIRAIEALPAGVPENYPMLGMVGCVLCTHLYTYSWWFDRKAGMLCGDLPLYRAVCVWQ